MYIMKYILFILPITLFINVYALSNTIPIPEYMRTKDKKERFNIGIPTKRATTRMFINRNIMHYEYKYNGWRPGKIKNNDAPKTTINRYYKDMYIPEEVFSKLSKQLSEENSIIYLPQYLEPYTDKVPDKELNKLGINELIGVSHQHFLDYSKDRKYNIKHALERFDGLIIAPHETISFNDVIGEISGSTGYKKTKIILNGKEVVGDGGGVCQVSSGVFQSVYGGGLDIIKRQNHSIYFKEFYTAGLDATVFQPAPDLIFKNDNDTFVLLKVVLKDNILWTMLYGTRNKSVALEKISQYGSDSKGMGAVWKRYITTLTGEEISTEELVSKYNKRK